MNGTATPPPDNSPPQPSPPKKQESTASGENKTRGAVFGAQAKVGKAKALDKVSPMKTLSLLIVDNKFFVLLTTLLTILALTGDDFRLLFTYKPADTVFDYLTGICLVVFTVEIVLSILAKDDYFLGFFFCLDVISTITLILDFSSVKESMAGGSEDDDNASSLRSSRTARIGAKAGRIVRVIRLVRILKLYKAIHDARQRQKQRAKEMSSMDDEDDWDEEDIEAAESNLERQGQGKSESRVGKKLSDMTTRRVICLVLAMLLVFPTLQADGVSQLATSGWYGADNVWKHYEYYIHHPNEAHAFEDYEHSLLTYVFFHNWYSDRGFCDATGLRCANQYFSHLFWVGIMGPKDEEANITAYAKKSQLSKSSIDKFVAAKLGNKDDIYSYGESPPEVLDVLASPWSTRCETKKKLRLGLSLIADKSVLDKYKIRSDEVTCPDELRPGESLRFYTRMINKDSWLNGWYMVYYFDARPFTRTDAGFNLLVTGFICIVLCTASLLFTNDANKLVLNPVENMIKRVEAIRRDPLVAMQMADEEFKHELIAQAKKKRRKLQAGAGCQDALAGCKNIFAKSVSEPMETVILEKTIIKLGSLLALGFGEAGAGIVAHNMKGSDSASVNAMIPGRTVHCILGMARIKNFSTANEVLSGSIMTFANQLAEIVHGVVNEYWGCANKNNGDSFLLIWRMMEEDYFYSKTGELKCTWKASRMAELSVVSFARIIGSLHHSPTIAEYRTHPGLQQRLGSGTRVHMSFGLHFGWAIEGAVGSEFKIDASYLSPNVSIANGIERSANTYGVPFILAESVFALLDTKMQERLRLVDRVILTGSTEPMRIFSVDLDVMAVQVGPPPMKIPWNPRQRFKARQYLESEKQAKMKDDLKTITLFDMDPNIKAMRAIYTTAFMNCFRMGYENYSEGEWPVARRMLIATQTMLGIEDGPSSALLKYMEQHQFQAPKEWKPPGIRDLDRQAAGVTTI